MKMSNVSSSNVDYCYRVRDIPKTYNDAITSPESQQWQKAMEEEISSLIDNNTYDLTPLPEGRTVVGGRWVYAVKLGPNDEEKFKARYVAKGYSQIKDIDYHETFAPTARITSVRMLMQIAVQEDLIIDQMDVKTAYLNAAIDTEIYVAQPEGFIKSDENGTSLVCKLNKSLYGLKQSGRNWNHMLHNFLLGQNFVQSLADPCLYVKFVKGIKTIIIIWVDDILIAANSEYVLNDVKTALSKKFKMKDLNRLTWFLGIEFKVNDCISMNQFKYLDKILNKFGMTDCNPKGIPCDLSANKIIDSDSKELADSKLYREIVGSLIYIMTGTRPDICFAVTKLSQHMSNPTKAHLNLAKHVLKYLKGTVNYDLKFYKSDLKLELFGFCDSDWGMSEDRKKYFRFLLFIK